MLKFILILHRALASWETKAVEHLLKAPALPMDETSLRVDWKNQWIHVYSAGDITLKLLHQKRGKEAIESINLIPRYVGIIIHDCWSSYFAYQHYGHGLCGSHLLRELTFRVDIHDYRWAKQMKPLLQQACITVSKSTDKKLTETERVNLQKRYRAILTRGQNVLPAIYAWPKSNKRSRAAFVPKSLLMPTAEYPAICKPWLIEAVIRSSRFKWLSQRTP